MIPSSIFAALTKTGLKIGAWRLVITERGEGLK